MISLPRILYKQGEMPDGKVLDRFQLNQRTLETANCLYSDNNQRTFKECS